MKIFGWIVVAILALAALCVGRIACTVATDAIGAAYEEVNPYELKREYEFWKRAYAKLQSQEANIKGYEAQIADFQAQYGEIPYRDWDHGDKTTFNKLKQERRALCMSFNRVATEYNAKMVIIYDQFMNIGDLPAGGVEFPREVVTYIVN